MAVEIETLVKDCPVGTMITWNGGDNIGRTTCEPWEVAPGEPVVRAGKYEVVVGMKDWPNNKAMMLRE